MPRYLVVIESEEKDPSIPVAGIYINAANKNEASLRVRGWLVTARLTVWNASKP